MKEFENISKYVRLRVVGMTRNRSRDNYFGLVLQEETGNRRLQIVIGASEAQSIECVLRRMQPPRPLTHDLMYSVMQTYGLRLESVVLDLLPEGVYSGALLLTDVEHDNKQVVDARSSDAIALALRFDVTIFIDPDLLNTIGVSTVNNQVETLLSDKENIADNNFNSLDGADMDIAFMNLEQLRKQMKNATQQEKYEEAARLKAEIMRRFPNAQNSQNSQNQK